MVYLKEMNFEDAKVEWEFFQSCPAENGVDNEFMGMGFEEFCSKGIAVNLAVARGENLINGFVPETYFFCMTVKWERAKLWGFLGFGIF